MPDSAVVNTFGRGWPHALQAYATPRAAWLLLGVLCAAGWFVFSRWPFVVDLPLMHYVAWRVNAGDAPYVDVWDMNGPVAYMAHQLMLLIPLEPTVAMPLLMTLLTGACAAGVATIAGRGGRHWLGFAAGVAMLAWVLARGNDYVMQRDTLIAAMALGALVLVSAKQAPGWRWAAAGALIGLAVGVKPTAAPFALIALAGAAWIDMGEGRRFARTLWLVAGGAAGGAAWIGWLVATGGLAGFWHIMTDYNAAYMKVARVSWGALAREPSVWIALAAAMGCVAALSARVRAKAPRGELALIGMAGAFALWAALAYVMQGKGWVYQTAPNVILAMAAAGAALSTVQDLRAPVRRWAVVAGVLGSCAAAVGGIREQVSPAFAQRADYRTDIAADMTEALAKLPAGMKVQPLDTTDGALQAMWRTRREPASPVMYDFWLFEGSAQGVADSRAAVLAAVTQADAPAILMTNQGWPVEGTGFARMREFKEFQAILDARYVLVAEGRRGPYGYRLFAPA